MKAALLLVAVLASTAHADELNLANTTPARPHIVSVRTGLDHAFVAEVGYDHVFGLCDRVVIAGLDIAVPWAGLDVSDFQVGLGATMPLLERGAWKLLGRLGPTLRGTDTAAAQMTSLGLDARISGGYFRTRGFAAAELGVDWAATTHISHADAYREQVYPDAQDGWYRATGGTLRAGLYGGVSFGNVDAVLRVGRPFAIDFAEQTIPFYVTLGANVAL
ncbi:MAG: hypothetical protein SFX73_16435 [Kofleriaceae bacterium]|nr:hypothetical protein [Kofleriaceae bacterium]